MAKIGEWLGKPLVALAACLAAGLSVYAPALNGTFVWDDAYLVQENPFFRSPMFGLEVFRHYLFFDSFSTYYRPVQNWSYICDYWIWGGNPMGYHLTNILVHSLSGFLLFLLLCRLLPGLLGPANDNVRSHCRPIAILVALVWVVHPIHNAAIAYISGRADSLAAFFALGAWLLALKALRGDRYWLKMAFGVTAVGSMLIAMCSKEIALVWLVLILVHLLFFDRGRLLKEKGVVLGCAAGVVGFYAILHALPGYRVPMQDGPPASWDARVLLMLRALGDYTGLMFYPGKLYMERTISSPAIYRTIGTWREHAHYEYLSLIGLLAGVSALYFSAKGGPGQRLRVFGAAWFVIAFLPISNLFPLNAEVAEHWIYLASIGFLLFIAGSVLVLSGRARLMWTALASLAIVGLGARTVVRSGDWLNAETFCARTIASGGASPRILSALAAAYAQRGDYQKQEQVLRKTIEQYPEFPPARMNLGICLSRQGRVAEAEALLGASRVEADEVARQYPRTWPAALHLVQIRRAAKQTDEAVAILREARARFPEIWELVKCESDLVRETSGPVAAIPLVARFAEAHWWHFDAWVTLGTLHFAAGEPDAAITAMRHASRLDIHDGRALAGIAQIESERGRPDAALAVQLEAMERDPDQPGQYVALAGILEKLGRKDEANGALRKAKSLIVEARRSS